MIPVGAPMSSLTEGVTEAEDIDGITRRHQETAVVDNRNNTAGGDMARMDQRQQQNGNELSGPDSMTNANIGTSSFNASYIPQRSLTTPSESLPVFSDAPSQLPSELDTDMDSNILHEGGEHIDTVIDTPLAGFTPEPFDLHVVRMLRRDGRTKSIESQRADTIDTGIELELEDVALTPGTTSVTRPEDLAASKHHQFLDIPAKRKNYLSERSKLEQHYFPEERHHQQQQNNVNGSNQRNRDSGSVTPTLPTPNWSPSPGSTSPHSGRVTWGQHTTTSDSSPERQRRNITPGTASSHSHPTPERTRKNNSAPRSPKGARAFSINPQGATAGYNNQNESQTAGGFSSSQDNRRNVAPRSPKGARRMMVNHQTSSPYPARQHSSLSGHSSERSNSYYPPSPNRSPARQPRGAYGYPHPHPPERSHSMPQHLMAAQPTRQSSNRGYPAAAVNRSPPRQPRGASISSYNNQTRDDGYGGGSGSLHDHDSRWDHWTAQNTQFNAAQAVATQLRVEGTSGSAGVSSGEGSASRNRRSGSGIHKENSPAVKSENSVDVDHNRSFKIARTTPKANPYYSPHVPKRREMDPAPHSVPQLRRMTSNQDRPMTYQHQYSRHSGEYNPRFSMEFENRSGARMSESYPSPGVARTSASGLPMAQRSPHYPRTPQGASAKAPRMVRSLKSTSPQRSIISYGSGVAIGVGGGGDGASGRVMGASTATASATSSRPNSLHSTSAFPPLQPYQHHQQYQHPGVGTRYSDGASAAAWVTPNAQWPAARTQRMSSVQLHVPRSSAHESAV